MKICPRCQKTYSDEGLNFCLDDGTTLIQSKTSNDSMPATVMMNQPRPTASNQSFGNQSGSQSGNQANWNTPNQFSMQPPAPTKSKSWLWVVGILGGLVLLCGGGGLAFIFWAASLEDTDQRTTTNFPVNSPRNNATPIDKKTTQTIDLSKWVKGDTELGLTEIRGGEFVMGSKKKGYYYVLASQLSYKTENATTRVTVKNLEEADTSLGFGLIVNSNPVPLVQDYAFVIDSENKKYRVVRHVPGDEIIVVGWTRSSAIKDGIQENILEVRDKDKKMDFYINNEFVKSVDNTDGYSGGVTGLYSGDAVQIYFKDFEIIK